MADEATTYNPEWQHSPGPWEYIASTENHGPYVVNRWGGDVADCYTMSNPRDYAVCNGGTSRPVPFQQEAADANARLIAAAPELLASLQEVVSNILDYERVNNLAPNPGRKYCWDCVEKAVGVIEKATRS